MIFPRRFWIPLLAKQANAARVRPMSPIIFRSRIIVGIWALIAFFVGGKPPVARADAVAELASFSVFPRANLAQLSKGEYKTMRSGFGGNATLPGRANRFCRAGFSRRDLGEDAELEPGKVSGVEGFSSQRKRDGFFPAPEGTREFCRRLFGERNCRSIPPICNSAPPK